VYNNQFTTFPTQENARGLSQTIVNKYTMSLFYLTNAVCHNPPAFQRGCTDSTRQARVYTICKSSDSENTGKIMTMESNVAKNQSLQSAGPMYSVYLRTAYMKEIKINGKFHSKFPLKTPVVGSRSKFQN
jgi:hypothetical protein